MQYLLILCIFFPFVIGDVYDVLMPHYAPPSGCACQNWNNISDSSIQKQVSSYFTQLPNGNACAMPAKSAGSGECDGCTTDKIWNSFRGPWCVCEGTNDFEYCNPNLSIPEEINLQLASPHVIIASFVTFEKDLPSNPPVAELCEGKTCKTIQGISHWYKEPSIGSNHMGRTYCLNFVKFDALESYTNYTYKVKSGSDTAQWSSEMNFRSVYDYSTVSEQRPTRLAIYGDMGHSLHNNMGNLYNDCTEGVVDFIVHMGDHAYDMGNADMRRGDAYLNAFQKTLSVCPWIPIIGNHESNDGDHFKRYENITWGMVYGQEDDILHSTASTPLGEYLTKGSYYAQGMHGSLASKTSRYFSVDVGIIHFAALDGNNMDITQMEWLEADLVKAQKNRDNVPWIVVTSHFPLYHTSISKHLNASAAYYTGEASEKYATSGHEFRARQSNDELSLGAYMKRMTNAIEPLLNKYGVDIYDAGHVHDYESTWPICNGEACQKNYVHPKGTVHITEGNGGVPGVVGTTSLSKSCGSYCQSHGTGGAYGRLIAFNRTHITYEHVENANGKVTDTFTIVTDGKHEAFPNKLEEVV